MNFMTYGLPVIATVNPEREVARVVHESGGGWVVDASRPEELPKLVDSLRDRPDEVRERGNAARAYAAEHFSQDGFADRLDTLMRDTLTPKQARV
jgi:glycosyltransferase involved in cell wall biosynthesis